MDIDVGEGGSIKLLSAQGVADYEGGGDRDASAVGVGTAPTEIGKLEQSFQDLILEEGDEGANAKVMELISNLGAARAHTADLEQCARRLTWTEETLNVILERQLFRSSCGRSDLFPKLVRERILAKGDDPKEKGKLARMSLICRKVLKKERTGFLFNEVFAFLHAGRHLSRQELLLCRSVSREWRRSVDNWIQSFNEYPNQNYLQVRKLKPVTWADKVPLSFPVDVGRVGTFLCLSRHHLPPGGNPFLTRTLVLGSINPESWRNNLLFWREMERLLDLWGPEVWTAQVQFSSPNNFDAPGAYKLICGLLNRMPNLRHLVMLSPDPMDGEDDDSLETSMRGNPLPEMPHLKSIESSHVPSPMTKLMLEKYGPALETAIAYWVEGSVFEDAQLPNLKMLSLFPNQVSPLKMNWPSINDIDIRFDRAEVEDIPNIFRNLGDVGGTLRKLNLILENVHGSPTKMDAAATKMLTLELPNLEELSLAMCMGQGNLKRIDFILPMTKLKILSLTYVRLSDYGGVGKKPNKIKTKKRGHQLDPGSSTSTQKKEDTSGGVEVINYWKYINRLYDSNIWILFPELRKVTIATFVIEMLESSNPNGMALIAQDKLKENVFTREGYISSIPRLIS